MDELNEGIFENEFMSGEQESGEFGRHGFHPGGGWGRRQGQLFDEEQELDLATELLTVNNEQELEQFLGDIFKKVGQVAGKVINSPVGKALGGMLKPVLKKALPIVGGALGTFVGGPAGTAIGSQLGSAAGQLFGLELEGMSGEDRELEVAQRAVRLAADAAHQATQAPAGAPAQQVARAALTAAAARHAPGLLRNGGNSPAGALFGLGASSANTAMPGNAASTAFHPTPGGVPCGPGQHGRWIRRGNKIVLFGV